MLLTPGFTKASLAKIVLNSNDLKLICELGLDKQRSHSLKIYFSELLLFFTLLKIPDNECSFSQRCLRPQDSETWYFSAVLHFEA